MRDTFRRGDVVERLDEGSGGVWVVVAVEPRSTFRISSSNGGCSVPANAIRALAIVPKLRGPFQLGDLVVKDPAGWVSSDFDKWGAGEGVGVVVPSPFGDIAGEVDVVWPAGRATQSIRSIKNVDEI